MKPNSVQSCDFAELSLYLKPHLADCGNKMTTGFSQNSPQIDACSLVSGCQAVIQTSEPEVLGVQPF